MKNSISNKINDILILCSKHNMEFIYQKEGDENFIEYSIEPQKKIIINLPNKEDENLEEILDLKFKELNQFFQD